MKKILVLGGTEFVGRALVDKLIQHPGYELWQYNRGRTNADLFPTVNRITGDREKDDYRLIAAHEWDCIIDFSGYYPDSFERLLQSLKGKVRRYVFISTISVFDLGATMGKIVDEQRETMECSNKQRVSSLPDDYGEKKAEMERILLREQWLDAVILRPSFIYGAHDPTDRIYYWLYMAANADKVLMPEAGHYMSLTYAGDLVTILLKAIEKDHDSNIYHTISQQKKALADVVKVAAEILGRRVELVTISDEKMKSYSHISQPMPLNWPLSFAINGSKCIRNYDIELASFEQSIKETIDYGLSIGWKVPNRGLTLEQQKKIIAEIVGS